MNSELHINAIKTVKQLDIKAHILHWAKNEKLSFRKISIKAGLDPSFFHKKMKKGDLTGTEMIVIGNCLQVNPMELYMTGLDETCRPTRWEKELKKIIEEKDKRIAELEKERDLYKEIAMGRK